MKKILIIDDAEFILESTTTLLKFEGYDTVMASDGFRGVESAITDKPDLILCDISMPGMDGYKVLEKIRNESETKRTPFIFLTAFTDKSNMRAGMEKGADDYLIKPFTRDELLAAINAQWKKNSVVENQLEEKVNAFSKNLINALPHEFRTVLNQIIGSAKYINSNSDDINKEDLKELTNDIIFSSKRLLKIAENYLIYSRIETFAASKNIRDALRTFKTDEPAAMLLDIAYIIAQKYDRTSDLDVESDVCDVYVEMSTESFHKIIDELVENSFRFSEKGKPVLINLRLKDNFLEVVISDKGRGMSSEQIENIGALVQFERQLYEQQGVGLGLAISKKLVELHDGRFIIDSIINKGTNIFFTIPYKSNI